MIQFDGVQFDDESEVNAYVELMEMLGEDYDSSDFTDFSDAHVVFNSNFDSSADNMDDNSLQFDC